MLNIYTASAAKRLLPFATRIEAIREMKNCIQVTYLVKGGRRCSTFLSKKAFIADFSGIREIGSQSVEVVESTLYSYTVKSGNNYYVVRPGADRHHRCECGDCNFRGAFCKHQIAVADYCKESLGVA
jgi:hypothetical protein